MFDWRDVQILYLREMKSALRERNIVVNSILLPVFLYPLLLWLVYTGISFVGGQTEGFASRVMLKNLAAAHPILRDELAKTERVEIRNPHDPIADIRSGNLDALIEFRAVDSGSTREPGNFSVLITFDESKDRSRIARDRVKDRIARFRDYFLREEASRLGVKGATLQQFWVESKNVATSRQMGQFILGLMLPVFLIIMLSVGCMYPAIDSTAGEREKSTWETLMTVATARENLVCEFRIF